MTRLMLAVGGLSTLAGAAPPTGATKATAEPGTKSHQIIKY